MTATTAQSTPAVPPRPSRSTEKDTTGGASMPKIPPRPSKKASDRSISPNADRFAPSPLNEAILAKGVGGKPALLSPNRGLHEPMEDPIERAGSVDLPSVGQEGMEYSAVADEMEQERKSRAASPEQTRTVAEDLQLHAPKPSLPAGSAKQRVQAVTRTDSDRAASFGIGRPKSGAEDRSASRDGHVKRPSTSMSTSSDHGKETDDEHGIPEIGQRVPMNRHLGDVQAPSPAPSESSGRHHVRKHSARNMPPGSYGLHGHGVAPQDKLEKDYYKKHPELLKQEEHTPLHDRQNDYAMSRTELDKLVRDTTRRFPGGVGTGSEYRSTPTDEVAFQASDQYVRQASPRPGSAAAKKSGHRRSSSLAQVETSTTDPQPIETEEGTIHVDDPRHPEYRSYGDEDSGSEEEDRAPILAADEVEKDSARLHAPAVRPRLDRRSSNNSDDGQSRPSSRPLSLHHANSSQPEIRYTPLEDVEEYEPLFPDEDKKREAKKAAEEAKNQRHFPSKDIWEDAPSSVHYTATVSTPDLPETEHHRSRSSGHQGERPMTPAHAFAAHQEALAEREAKRRSGSNFLPLNAPYSHDKPTWAAHQAHLKVERPASGPRFPSKDVWEDVPESQLHETIISSPEEEKEKPEIPARPAQRSSESSERPAIPTRPKPRQGSGDDAKAKPPIAEKPKPQIPARPSKQSSGDSATKEKPPVPSRPTGSKIAALQAGFMNDLNARLKIGPVVHKKEEEEKQPEEEKEKIPLSDARKGRARGPQRRAPAKSPAPPAAEEAKPSIPTLTFTMPQSSWSIDPDVGGLTVEEEEDLKEAKKAEETKDPEETKEAPTVEEANAPLAEDTPEDAEPKPELKTDLEEVKPGVTKTEEPSKDEERSEAEETSDEPPKEMKTLVSNMAGESVLEATVEKKDGGDEVEPVDVEEDVKS